MSRTTTGWIIAAMAIAQIAVQPRCFLHIGWPQKCEDLQLIDFSLLLLGLMVGGTLWIIGSLSERMH